RERDASGRDASSRGSGRVHQNHTDQYVAPASKSTSRDIADLQAYVSSLMAAIPLQGCGLREAGAGTGERVAEPRAAADSMPPLKNQTRTAPGCYTARVEKDRVQPGRHAATGLI